MSSPSFGLVNERRALGDEGHDRPMTSHLVEMFDDETGDGEALSTAAQPKAADATSASALALDSVPSVSISSTPLNATARPVLATPIVKNGKGPSA